MFTGLRRVTLASLCYLDHNASALPWAPAARAAADWLLGGIGNPSSVHRAGRAARAAVEGARRQVAAQLGVAARELTFTSGATEALHLAIVGGFAHGAAEVGGHLLTSAVEHPAVYGAAEVARAEVVRLPVDALGRVPSPAAWRAACTATTRLVVVMAAQNELGNTYDVAAIAAAVAPVPVVCDAVQAWGKVALDLGAWSRAGVAAVALSGHKIGAPAGVGVLWSRAGFDLRGQLEGGGQERGRRAGTENVAGIVGLGAAAAGIAQRLASMPAVAARRDALQAALGVAFGPRLVMHGDPSARLPNTLAFRVEGVPADLVVQALDLEGICVSAGSACASGALEASPVLKALGLDERAARSGVRVSLGPETTDEDVARLATVLPQVVARAEAAGEVARCA